MASTVKVYSENYGPRQTMNVGGKSYQSDMRGVFEMSEEHAEKLVGTPGWKEGVPGEESQKRIRAHGTPQTGASQAASDVALLSAQIDNEKLKAELAEAKQKQAETEALLAQTELARIQAEMAALKAQVAQAPQGAPKEPAKESAATEPASGDDKPASRPRRAAPTPE